MRVGLGAQTFGFFFKPMIEELGWNRTVMTAALLARDLVRATTSPAFGYAVDRYGPRFLMTGSAIVLGISLMLLSQTREIWHFVLFYGVIGTFGIPGLSYSVISPTIAKWFIRHRGKATGIATAGLNVGAVLLTPLILFLIQTLGWRTAWFVLGFVPWIVVVPPCLLWLRRQPEDMGLLPDGAAPAAASEASETDRTRQRPLMNPIDEVSWTVAQALRAPAFWLLVAFEVLSGMSIGALIIHRIPYVTDLGFSDVQAGISFAIYGVCAFASKMAWGVSGRPLLHLEAGHLRPGWQRGQHFRRRGFGDYLADVRNVRGDVRPDRRFAGGNRAAAVGGALRSAAPGHHPGSDESVLPHRQRGRAVVRGLRVRPGGELRRGVAGVRGVLPGQRGTGLAGRARAERGGAGGVMGATPPLTPRLS